MKVMLGNGWYQDVTLNNQGEQVIRYMKDGKEYSEEAWRKSKQIENKQPLNNETLNEIRSELDCSLGGVNAGIEVLSALQVETGRIEDDVVNMDMSSLTNMGLMMNDIQHKLIMINNLLHHELKELKGNYNDANELKQQLYKYEVIEQKENTPNSSKNRGSDE